ncbi:MAG: hypothetical protein LBT16_12150 [Treponema sp.]|jgi:hypothetical protein|nr:hypothetical protein [Treponema sp.]
MAKEKKAKPSKPPKEPKINLNGPMIRPSSFFTPQALFFEYILLSFAVLAGFRLIFPGEEAPLSMYSFFWRFTRGVLDFIALFPALVMTAQVIPFGLKDQEADGTARFNPNFLEKLRFPILLAIIATALYGVLFFLCLPVAENARQTIAFRGRLYKDAKVKVVEHAKAREWAEAAHFLTVCEQIWPNSPEMANLKKEVDIELYQIQYLDDAIRGEAQDASIADPRERAPVDAREALRFAEAAFTEQRYFDAHWLATLAGRLAPPGSAELREAARLAGRAWNAIESLSPNNRETELRRRFRLKQSGYEAMISEDWIRAYYIFKELAEILKDDPKAAPDPDVANFLAQCEEQTLQIAFFFDELDELTLGNILTEAVFSLPRLDDSGRNNGRLVLRVGGLSTFQDYSYGFDVELLAVDDYGALLNRLEAPYAKFLPKTLNGKPRVVLLLQALDRNNRDRRWGPEWSGPVLNGLDRVEVVLDLSYENFLLITRVRRGINTFQIPELFAAQRSLAPYGYIPKVFLAEAVNRIAEPIFLLPMLIFILILGWRYRAINHPQYLGIPMLVILPVVFNALIDLYRVLIDNLGIWMAVSLSFNSAMVMLGVIALILFFLSLIILAAQRG